LHARCHCNICRDLGVTTLTLRIGEQPQFASLLCGGNGGLLFSGCEGLGPFGGETFRSYPQRNLVLFAALSPFALQGCILGRLQGLGMVTRRVQGLTLGRNSACCGKKRGLFGCGLVFQLQYECLFLRSAFAGHYFSCTIGFRLGHQPPRLLTLGLTPYPC